MIEQNRLYILWLTILSVIGIAVYGDIEHGIDFPSLLEFAIGVSIVPLLTRDAFRKAFIITVLCTPWFLYTVDIPVNVNFAVGLINGVILLVTFHLLFDKHIELKNKDSEILLTVVFVASLGQVTPIFTMPDLILGLIVTTAIILILLLDLPLIITGTMFTIFVNMFGYPHNFTISVLLILSVTIYHFYNLYIDRVSKSLPGGECE
jgi:hypothetical protein